MTDATTADKLAAWELIKEHGLDLFGNRGGTRTCAGPLGVCGTGSDDVAAVRAWAEAAGVPWPSVNVVPMWAVVDEHKIMAISEKLQEIDHNSGLWGNGHLAQCEVVIVETKGV